MRLDWPAGGNIAKGLLRSSTASCFYIQNFDLQFLKQFKVSSRLILNLSPNSWDDGLHGNLSSCWPAHFHLMKNPPNLQAVFPTLPGDPRPNF